ncbi:hypothetical protein BDN72DRAFT_865970 [Pluteus cervinus]|uniref:Uncharacterized protein n=1 Tax=Pluteus cervinus TaxID=181527 RepID=A0ACD2ZZ40_9AGAR|nr:hypothetical protein BDN72DRAFT_865970 [Pluteus cervinus]
MTDIVLVEVVVGVREHGVVLISGVVHALLWQTILRQVIELSHRVSAREVMASKEPSAVKGIACWRAHLCRNNGCGRGYHYYCWAQGPSTPLLSPFLLKLGVSDLTVGIVTIFPSFPTTRQHGHHGQVWSSFYHATKNNDGVLTECNASPTGGVFLGAMVDFSKVEASTNPFPGASIVMDNVGTLHLVLTPSCRPSQDPHPTIPPPHQIIPPPVSPTAQLDISSPSMSLSSCIRGSA